MVLFEVPTGIVADTIGRRVSYLLGTVTLTASTVLYVLLWQIEAPFWAWALASILLGLGFTFFSGAVEAWLVDALAATGFTGELETVFGRGQIVSGDRDADRLGRRRAYRPGDQPRGAVRAPRPSCSRSCSWSRSGSCTTSASRPRRAGGPLAEMRKIAADSIEYGWRVPAVKWLMVAALFTGGVGIYAFYALQPYLLELYGDPNAYSIAGLVGRDRRRRADPRRDRRAAHPAALPPPHLGAARDRGAQRRRPGADRR